ncbi:Short-chain-enoyl-CoA hydratase [Paraburkholderia domus]|uniref:enoyl-CoA hydratase/isomerase family protein n=1 Tax=Paraburkholderia domus TaxID=2793075 RepID=UPI001912F25A|nr:enoyl-CoA hydratase/isomerase family protein [Paraburkholderia domus]MBK5050512.1 enoyl-CoA hydratase/isomerase family protein [Burkholderia sp. R-70006]CAE6753414.1 Short-chain-enoyl-CoA hydratase [Paraburkholderia domus]
MTHDDLLFDVKDGVATLTLNRPEQKNALSSPMRDGLDDAVRRIRRDREIRAVILRGAGGDFCSGGDVRGMSPRSAEDGRNRIDDLHPFVSALIDLDRPVIAAVDGVAYGAGFSLALTADFVIATPRARFCLPFLKVGLVPDCGAFYTLPRVIGLSRAKDLVFTGREIGAEEAQRMGAVFEIHSPDALYHRAEQIAQSLSGASSIAFGLSKRALNMSLSGDLRTLLEMESAAQGIACTTQAHQDAVQRFKEKLPARFQWTAG